MKEGGEYLRVLADIWEYILRCIVIKYRRGY